MHPTTTTTGGHEEERITLLEVAINKKDKDIRKKDEHISKFAKLFRPKTKILNTRCRPN
jgi:hypothetical protein